jgi:hypothetical protein
LPNKLPWRRKKKGVNDLKSSQTTIYITRYKKAIQISFPNPFILLNISFIYYPLCLSRITATKYNFFKFLQSFSGRRGLRIGFYAALITKIDKEYGCAVNVKDEDAEMEVDFGTTLLGFAIEFSAVGLDAVRMYLLSIKINIKKYIMII